MRATFEHIEQLARALYGLPCCRRRVGSPRRGISIGFGEQRFHGNPTLKDDFYGEWEIGTYYGGWRIVSGGVVACGSDDVVDSIDELNERVARVELGRPVSIRMLSELDVRLALDNGSHVDFLGSSGEDEHVIHIFGPDDLYIDYTSGKGWEVGSSIEPEG